jgi:hypothetical protein
VGWWQALAAWLLLRPRKQGVAAMILTGTELDGR